MFELMDAHSQSAVIKVIGVGGGGGNAVAHMVNSGIEGVDFICANTDAQALNSARVRTALQIGCNITKGLGAGADPEVGQQAAMEDRDRIQKVIEGADMLLSPPAWRRHGYWCCTGSSPGGQRSRHTDRSCCDQAFRYGRWQAFAYRRARHR